MAMASIDAMKLGRGAGDGFSRRSASPRSTRSATTSVPTRTKSQDVLIHLDAQMGLLLDKLDRDVGKGNYVVGLTSDHGVAPVPERVKAQGFDAGRIDNPADRPRRSTPCCARARSGGRTARA